MATINPTSQIKIFSGVPLDPDYQNTLYFADAATQLSYFGGLTPLATFTANMYTRVSDGVFEAKCPIETVYRANYMMFRNDGFENHWFFAFVTDVEYINNNNTRVKFQIDVIQTWLLDVTLKRCFIERQHTRADGIGLNILPEPVALGEYKFDTYQKLTQNFEHYAVLIMIASTEANQSSNGGMYDNVYSGAGLYAVDAELTGANGTASLINSFLADYNPKPEQIINMYMCPINLLPVRPGTSDVITSYSQVAAVPSDTSGSGAIDVTLTALTGAETFGGYTPKNKKLYTYPYNFYHVDNGDGGSLNLRYEFFSQLAVQLHIEGCITTPVQLKLVPKNYKGTSGEMRSEFIVISAYPLCSWNYDSYRAWVAQNSVPTALGLAGAASGLVLAGVTGGAGLATMSAIKSIPSAIGIVDRYYNASQESNVCRGNFNSGNVNFANRKQSFYGCRAYVNEYYAEMIDQFFTMYGYQINSVAVPYLHARPHWTYIKTRGANIIGNCPAADLVRMKQCFDDGITFWISASEVGNYNLDNSPS